MADEDRDGRRGALVDAHPLAGWVGQAYFYRLATP